MSHRGTDLRERLGTATRVVLLATLVASSIWYGAADLAAIGSLSWNLRPLTMEERRRTLFGTWHDEAMALRADIPQSASVDLVMLRPEARDIAVLAGALLYPRDVRYFDGWDAWRKRRRAQFFHDARAANAAPAPPPRKAAVTVVVDPGASPAFRVVH